MARTVRPGTRQRQRLSRHVVGHGERALEGAGARPRQLVADRLEGSHLPHDRHDDGRRLSLLAYRRADGKLLWETSRPTGRRASVHHEEQPRVGDAGDRRRAHLCLVRQPRAAGVRHRREAGLAPDLGPIDNYHGTAGSPLLYKDRVILYQDQSAGAFIAAFDARPASRCGGRARDASVGWGTPMAIRVGDHDEIIVSSQARVHAYNPDTGARAVELRRHEFEVIPTPVVGHGMVFCSSGRAGPTLAIQPGGKGDVTGTHSRGQPARIAVRAVADCSTATTSTWSTTWRASPRRFEAATGKVMWQGRLGVAQREGFSASPVAVDGKVFFTNDEGETFVLRAGADVRAAARQPASASARWRRRRWSIAGVI